MRDIQVSVLGSLELRVDGVAVSVSAGKAAVLSSLALLHPDPVDHHRLAALVWSDPPANAKKAIQNQVKRLRSEFGADIIVTAGGGYQLGAGGTVEGRARVREVPAVTTDRSSVREQLKLWRGVPYANLAPATEVWLERDQLEVHRQLLLDWLANWPTPVDSESAFAGPPTRPNLDPLQEVDEPGRSSSTIVLSRQQEELVEEVSKIAAAAGRGSRPEAIVIAGTAGSGKTTLVDAFVAEQPADRVVLRASCSESPAAAHETVSGLLSSLPRGVPIDPGLRIMDRFISALVSIEQPVLVVIDDFHWATLALCELLGRIAHQAPHTTVVLGTRDGPAAHQVLQAFEVFNFEPPLLDETALGRLVRAAVTRRGGSAEVDDVVAEIYFLTGGAALFSVRLIEELDASNAWVEVAGAWSFRSGYPVPSSLSQAVANRYIALGMRARHFIELVATLHLVGGSSSTEFLQGHDPSATAEAQSSGLVAAGAPALWVMHAEVARAIAESLSDGSRAELHALAADLLRDDAPIGAARHALRAPTLPADIVSGLIEAAADFAYEQADYATAVQMCESAVTRATAADRPLEELIDLTTRLCDAARRAGDPRQLAIMSDLIGLVQASGDVERMAMAVRVICKLGASSDVEPRPDFVAFVEETLAHDLSPSGRATVLAASTQLYAISNYPVARDRFVEAYELATRIDDSDLIAFVLPGAYMSLADPGDLALRTKIGMELLRRSALDSDPTAAWEAHHLLWSCAVVRGDGVRMAHHLRATRSLPGSRAEPVKEATVAYMTAAAACLEGDLDMAESQAEQFLTLSGAVGPQRGMAVYGALITVVRREQGRLAEMVPLIEALYADQAMVVAWQGVLALLYSETGQLDRAETLVAELLADDLAGVQRGITHSAVVYAIGDAAANVGDRLQCQQLLELLEPYSGMMSFSGTCSLGSLDLVRGRLAVVAKDVAAATTYLDNAESVAQSSNWPAIEMRAQLARARINPHTPEAQQALRTTFSRATQLGLNGVAQRARRLSRG